MKFVKINAEHDVLFKREDLVLMYKFCSTLYLFLSRSLALEKRNELLQVKEIYFFSHPYFWLNSSRKS